MPRSPRLFLCLAYVWCAVSLGTVLLPAVAPAQFTQRHVYPDPSSAHEDLAAALVTAKHDHKRILVDFGADWCIDCLVLDHYLGQAPNADLLAKNFIKVDVNVGHYDSNLDLAKRFNIPLNLGVPALAILDSNGHLLFAQQHKEFEHMSQMQSSDVTAFLNLWKPPAR